MHLKCTFKSSFSGFFGFCLSDVKFDNDKTVIIHKNEYMYNGTVPDTRLLNYTLLNILQLMTNLSIMLRICYLFNQSKLIGSNLSKVHILYFRY